MGVIINGLAFGFIVSVLVSMYVDSFFGNLIPIWINYGIFAPLLSAVAIIIGLASSKEKRQQYLVPGYYEKREEETG